MRTAIIGSGNVGRALSKAARAAEATVTLRAARHDRLRPIDADLVILAVRDGDLRPFAKQLAASAVIPRHAACVHVAGSLDAEVLAPLRSHCAGVAQMHPMMSFASRRAPPDLRGGFVLVQGDPLAAERARTFATTLGMIPHTAAPLDAAAYHAAATMTASGAVALASLSARLLVASGVAPRIAPRALGALLRSVAENIAHLGFPDALTGPARRGDHRAIERHLETLRRWIPDSVEPYRALLHVQVDLARAVGEASSEELDAILAVWDKPR